MKAIAKLPVKYVSSDMTIKNQELELAKNIYTRPRRKNTNNVLVAGKMRLGSFLLNIDYLANKKKMAARKLKTEFMSSINFNITLARKST